MEGYKCPKCYKIGLTTSFISNHICFLKPIQPIENYQNKKPIRFFKNLLINESPTEIIGNLKNKSETLETER
jgi:hypothetical protein